jgi:hypothetical protein
LISRFLVAPQVQLELLVLRVQQVLRVLQVLMVQMVLPDHKDLQGLTVLRELPAQLELLVLQAQMGPMALTGPQQRLLWAPLRLL